MALALAFASASIFNFVSTFFQFLSHRTIATPELKGVVGFILPCHHIGSHLSVKDVGYVGDIATEDIMWSHAGVE